MGVKYARFLQNIVLYLAFLTTIFEHFGHTRGTTHTGAERCTNFRGVHVLVEFVWIGDTSIVESLSCAHQRP